MRQKIVLAIAVTAALIATTGAFAGSPYTDADAQAARRPALGGGMPAHARRRAPSLVSSRAAAQWKTGN